MTQFISLSSPRLEIFQQENEKTKLKEWRWHITVKSDIVSASSEGYHNRQECLDNILKTEEHIKYLREQDLIK